MVNRKSTKLPFTWSSEVPRRYKHNVIIGGFTSIKNNFDERS